MAADLPSEDDEEDSLFSDGQVESEREAGSGSGQDSDQGRGSDSGSESSGSRSGSGSEEEEVEEEELVTGKRRRTPVDYQALHVAMFGDDFDPDESDSDA
jgi:hypothetical protein